MIENFGEPVWECVLALAARLTAPSLHRADMQKAMWKKAESLGVKFRFGCRVQSIDCAAAIVKLVDGEELSADLIVAADGLHGMSRASLLGRPDPPVPTGNLACVHAALASR